MKAIPKPIRVRSEARLEFVRNMICLVSSHAHSAEHGPRDCVACKHTRGCYGGSDPNHIRKGSNSGVGTKPSDFRTVPLCRSAHEEYHQIGHDAFTAKYRLDLEAHIQRINREFEKAQPKPKRERKKAPGLKAISVQCAACGRQEKIPASKVTRYGAGLRYRCIRTNEFSVVSVK